MKTTKIVALLLLIAVALVWIERSWHSQPLKDEVMPPYGVGVVLAQEAAETMQNTGRVAIICLPVSSAPSKAQMEGLQRTLARHKNIKVVVTNYFNFSETALGRLSFRQLAAVINQDSNVDVIVSFLGVTSFTSAQIATLPTPSPKLVVMDWNPQAVQQGMQAGLVKAAVMARRLTAVPTDHPKTPHQWFDRYYNLVTPESGRVKAQPRRENIVQK